MKYWIIADSGGTSTTWVYGSNVEIGRFETASLHVRNLETFPDEDFLRLQQVNSEFSFDELDFYGAGMSLPENKEQIRKFLTTAGFRNIYIETDALAAGLACCGYEHGFAAILGTGSILIEMNNGEMVSRRGGLGPEKGDQGSAYYFGKLFIEAVKKGRFEKDIVLLFGSRDRFLNEYEHANPTKMASLAKLTVTFNTDQIHRENVRAFITSHNLAENQRLKELNIIGSYGYHVSAILREELEKVNIRLNRVFTAPLDNLVALRIKNSNG